MIESKAGALSVEYERQKQPRTVVPANTSQGFSLFELLVASCITRGPFFRFDKDEVVPDSLGSLPGLFS